MVARPPGQMVVFGMPADSRVALKTPRMVGVCAIKAPVLAQINRISFFKDPLRSSGIAGAIGYNEALQEEQPGFYGSIRRLAP